MYEILPSFALGFHGCDRLVAEKVVAGNQALRSSNNDYDWLGPGSYFWENSPARALRYAEHLRDHPRRRGAEVETPAAVGAVIDLGFCLNLLDATWLDLVAEGFNILEAASRRAGVPLPANKPVRPDGELLIRELDCAVIRAVHETRRKKDLRPFDSVRAAFWEGSSLYEQSGSASKNHIQICVRNPRCIKGWFWPLEEPELPDEFIGWQPK